jgi:hypothetical protein
MTLIEQILFKGIERKISGICADTLGNVPSGYPNLILA